MLSREICLLCNKAVMDSVFCKVCKSPYHPKCAKRVNVLENGAYSECCKPRPPLPMSSTDLVNSASSHTDDDSQTTTSNKIEQIMTKVISKLQVKINKNVLSLSTTMTELSAKIISMKVDDIKETVNIHAKKIVSLEGTIENLNVKSLSTNCVTLVQDCLSRSHNLILFGRSKYFK